MNIHQSHLNCIIVSLKTRRCSKTSKDPHIRPDPSRWTVPLSWTLWINKKDNAVLLANQVLTRDVSVNSGLRKTFLKLFAFHEGILTTTTIWQHRRQRPLLQLQQQQHRGELRDKIGKIRNCIKGGFRRGQYNVVVVFWQREKFVDFAGID